MSDDLRTMLAQAKTIIDEPSAAPVTYLHGPDGKMFAALVSLEMTDVLADSGKWDSMDHAHIEGDEDEL